MARCSASLLHIGTRGILTYLTGHLGDIIGWRRNVPAPSVILYISNITSTIVHCLGFASIIDDILVRAIVF